MATNRLILRTLTSPWVTPISDITKGSVLTHADVDNNWIYLRGEVIYTANTVGPTLILKKINGGEILIELSGVNTYTTNAILSGDTLIFDRNDTSNAYNVDLSSLGQTGSTLVPLIYNDAITVPNNSIKPAFGLNTIFGSSTFSSILGGNNNTISGSTANAIIGGGYSNKITNSDLTIIVGGRNNLIEISSKSFIGGGDYNKISNSLNSSIIGGSGNYIDDISTPNSFVPDGIVGRNLIGGGFGNIIESGGISVVNSIVGGINNFINNYSFSTSIVGGWGNKIYSGYNTLIGGGRNNTISGSSYSSVNNGQNNLINNINNVHIIGSNITATTANTTYVNNLNIYNTPVTDNSLNDLLVRDTNGQVRVRQASSFTGGTSATTATLTTKFAITTGFTQDVILTINHGFNLSAGEEYDIVVKLRDIDNNIEIAGVIDNFQANDVDITLSQTYTNVRVVIIA
jgi:hypothetical protein